MDSTDSTNVDPVEIELLLIFPLEASLPPAPYSPSGDRAAQIRQTVRALRRSIELKNRLKALINAFYLGKLFDDGAETISQKFLRKREVNRHYVAMADKIYDVFETNPASLLETSTITVQQARRWKRPQVLRYRSIVEGNIQNNFVGAQN